MSLLRQSEVVCECSEHWEKDDRVRGHRYVLVSVDVERDRTVLCNYYGLEYCTIYMYKY